MLQVNPSDSLLQPARIYLDTMRFCISLLFGNGRKGEQRTPDGIVPLDQGSNRREKPKLSLPTHSKVAGAERYMA